MSHKRVWLVTGAGRGMGTDIATAALDAGHAVVATGRDTNAVTTAIGEHDDLLVVRLDVTSADEAEAAVNAAVERFGHLDVLVNNAGNFFAGFFEELSPAQVEAQVRTILFGTMTVTRAALPTMRAQRSGQVVAISSVAGLIGQEFCSAYAAAKFGVEGFIESLATEVAQFGIGTTIVEPGFFRTDLLTPESTTWAELSVDDYAEQAAATKEAWQAMNGQQGGDPAKLARALIEIVGSDEPPARWVAGADAVEAAEGKARTLLAQIDAHRALSSSLAHNDAEASS
jgi:NAD(P)-dependent dehydrogenase (short-subunit alcohol dehydrogenase family)